MEWNLMKIVQLYVNWRYLAVWYKDFSFGWPGIILVQTSQIKFPVLKFCKQTIQSYFETFSNNLPYVWIV